MNDSILDSVKESLGIVIDDNNFDNTLLLHINSVFSILNQLGIGPIDQFSINNRSNIWSEFMVNASVLNAVKSYMYLKVKLLFDPPLNSSILESFKHQINELEWRLNVASDKEV